MTEPTEQELKAALRKAQASGSIKDKTDLRRILVRERSLLSANEVVLMFEIDRYLRS